MGTDSNGLRRASLAGLFIFSLVALVTILSAVIPILIKGQVPPPATDEGTQAHIFQLSILALLPTGLIFLATADWSRPLLVVRAVALPTLFVLASFLLLYLFEHVIS